MGNNNTSINRFVILSIGSLIISILVLIGVVFLWIYWNRGSNESIGEVTTEMTIRTALGKQEKLSPDEYTTVWLNSASTLNYSIGQKRQMMLSGEAYFDIRKNSLPFVLKLKEATLTTTKGIFCAEAFPAEEIIKVTLYDGNLSLKFKKIPGEIMLQHGVEIIINESSGNIQLAPLRKNIRGTAWMENKYEYVSLNSILYSLADYYGVSLTIERDDLAEMIYTFTFEGDKSLDEVMNIIKTVSGKVNYRIQGEELVIY